MHSNDLLAKVQYPDLASGQASDNQKGTETGVLAEALERHPMRLLGWCVLGNHWHFVV